MDEVIQKLIGIDLVQGQGRMEVGVIGSVERSFAGGWEVNAVLNVSASGGRWDSLPLGKLQRGKE